MKTKKTDNATTLHPEEPMSIEPIKLEELRQIEPEPIRYKRNGASTESIALVASRAEDGVVLCHDGPGIEAAVDAACSSSLQDLPFDDRIPDGLSVWEGRYMVERTYEGDYDASLEGKFRDLTDAEWTLLRDTGVPWELTDEPRSQPVPVPKFSNLDDILKPKEET